MKYDSYIPTRLTGVVDLIWEQQMSTAGKFSVLPSGKVELLFPLSSDVDIEAKKIFPNENPVKNLSSFLSGLHTRPLKMNFGQFHTFGIQMKPIAVKAIFGMPLCEIRDYFVEGCIVLKNIKIIEDKLHSGSNFLERAQLVEDFLFSKIHETSELHLAIQLDQALQKYNNTKHIGSYRSIEDMLGYSRTHTYRLFNTWFGTSAHSYQRLLQFIGAVEAIHDPFVNLIDVGLENGYYDQAHFIKSFRDFAGMTPGEYHKRMSAIPGQLLG